MGAVEYLDRTLRTTRQYRMAIYWSTVHVYVVVCMYINRKTPTEEVKIFLPEKQDVAATEQHNSKQHSL